jgi:Fe2+ or Zn2+ uptake regulation protein
MINAWELLLKAKLLADNKDEKEAIYFKNKGEIVKAASGNPKTISITKALNLLEASGTIKSVVSDNIRLLIEIRDESVHFIHNDMSLAVKIQSIGMASLKNFMTLAIDWFGFVNGH